MWLRRLVCETMVRLVCETMVRVANTPHADGAVFLHGPSMRRLGPTQAVLRLHYDPLHLSLMLPVGTQMLLPIGEYK